METVSQTSGTTQNNNGVSVPMTFTNTGTLDVTNCMTLPYLSWAIGSYSGVLDNFPLKIRKVENGYLLVNNGKEFVFSNIKSLATYLEKSEEKAKK